VSVLGRQENDFVFNGIRDHCISLLHSSITVHTFLPKSQGLRFISTTRRLRGKLQQESLSSSLTQNKNKSGGGAGVRLVKSLGSVGSKRALLIRFLDYSAL